MTIALGIEIIRVVRLHKTITVSHDEIMRLKEKLTGAILDEFEAWRLSETEKEIALLLIKGYSMQEIADLRAVKEKSVRQQATGIYTKANVSNRNELAAYFIEDLLVPGDSIGLAGKGREDH